MNIGKDLSFADLILTNTKVITLDDSQPRARGVVIAKGKMLHLQTTPNSSTHRSHKCRIINCHGKPVLPGFIDSHFHLHAFAERFVKENFRI